MGKRIPSKAFLEAGARWRAHLAEYRKAHPNLSLKQQMKGAKKTYKKSKSKSQPISIRTTRFSVQVRPRTRKANKKKTKRKTKRGSKKGGGKRKHKTSKKDKYICYTGIGAKKTGNHTEKEFLKVMTDEKYKFNDGSDRMGARWERRLPSDQSDVPKGVKTLNQWIKYSGAEKGKC